jgi:hypothetical protein
VTDQSIPTHYHHVMSVAIPKYTYEVFDNDKRTIKVSFLTG